MCVPSVTLVDTLDTDFFSVIILLIRFILLFRYSSEVQVLLELGVQARRIRDNNASMDPLDEQQGSSSSSSSREGGGGSGGDLRVPSMRSMEFAGLEGQREAWHAAAGAEAGQGDIVLTDVMMGGREVFESLPQLTQARPKMPVIIISANNTR